MGVDSAKTLLGLSHMYKIRGARVHKEKCWPRFIREELQMYHVTTM